MDKGEIYLALEKDFEATFIRELIPGILHNFANPLNGIMGRAKLLQRRIEENQKKLAENNPEIFAGMKEELQKIKTDIRSITQETEYFYDLFKDASTKFYSLAAKNEEKINFSQLLAAELRFANFYLDFKHEIKKEIQLDMDVPDFPGAMADMSVAFWRIIRFAMSRALNSPLKEFHLKTDYDSKYINVLIKSSSGEISAESVEYLMECLDKDTTKTTGSTIDDGLLLSLLLFDKYKAKINIFSEKYFTTISIGFPYRVNWPKTKKFK